METANEVNPIDAEIKNFASLLIENIDGENVIANIKTILQLAKVKYGIDTIRWAVAIRISISSGRPADVLWNDFDAVKQKVDSGITVKALACFIPCPSGVTVTVIVIEMRGTPVAKWLKDKVEIEGIAHLN